MKEYTPTPDKPIVIRLPNSFTLCQICGASFKVELRRAKKDSNVFYDQPRCRECRK